MCVCARMFGCVCVYAYVCLHVYMWIDRQSVYIHMTGLRKAGFRKYLEMLILVI